jgi:hypothetical protein
MRSIVVALPLLDAGTGFFFEFFGFAIPGYPFPAPRLQPLFAG